MLQPSRRGPSRPCWGFADAGDPATVARLDPGSDNQEWYVEEGRAQEGVALFSASSRKALYAGYVGGRPIPGIRLTMLETPSDPTHMIEHFLIEMVKI